jgi:NitT/TauT family transport system permease protein
MISTKTPDTFDPPEPERDVAQPARVTSGRGRRQTGIFRLRGDIEPRVRVVAFIAGVVAVVGLWAIASTIFAGDGFAVPTIAATWAALVEMAQAGTLVPDLLASTRRVAIGYSISIVIGIALGMLIGSFRSIDSFFEPQLGFLRYIPATALTPLFLIWLGIDEAPKIALIVVGTVFYNILMVADVVRAVPNELIKASYTLGASRRTVLRRVVFPYAWPGMIDVARINMAAAWLMLVVAELLAGTDGLAYRIARAQRFRAIDRMFALLLVLGVLGVLLDFALRTLRNRSARWAKD